MPRADLLARDSLHPDAPRVGEPMLELVTSLWNDSQQVNGRRFRAQKDELAYSLRLQHFVYDHGNVRDQRVLQPHGPELYSLLRHKWSSICEAPFYLECRPQSPDDPPEAAEDAKHALESVLHNPLKLYSRLRRRWVMGALAARAWVMAFDYEPGIGPYGGEIVFRLVPDWHFHVAPGWQDHHDETCPWVGESCTMRLGDIRQRGKYGWDVDGVLSDAQVASSGTGTGLPAPLGNSNLMHLTEAGLPTTDASETEVVTVLKWWFRYDSETYEQVSEPYQLPPMEQYGECPACGHQDATIMQRDNFGQVVGGPECPNCARAPMLPVTQAETVDVFARFPAGRLVIVAPHCRKVLYDDAWPQKLRSFPYMRLRCYDHPEEAVGQSDTSLHWTSQQILNGVRRFGWEQMRRNVDILVAPKGVLQNARGAPFQPSDVHGQIAWYTDPIAVKGLQHFQGSGLPPALIPFHNLMADQFRQAAGITDLGITQTESKDIPVGTIKQMTQTLEIPVRDHIQQLREEESIGFSVLLDMIVQTWGPERPVRYLGPDGQMRVERLRGALLTSMDVVVTASPDMSAFDAEELNAVMQWASILQTDPALGMLVAQIKNIPPSYIQQYLTARQQMAAQAAAQAAAAPQTAGAPGAKQPGARPAPGANGNGIPPPIAARMGSMNGAQGGVTAGVNA